MADNTALVLVKPEATLDAVLADVRQTGAPRVQLLVTEGATALRQPGQATRLRELAEAEGIDLVVISSDPDTLAVAQASGVQTLTVAGAHVQAPLPPAVSSLTDTAPAPPAVTPPGLTVPSPAPPAVTPPGLEAGDALFLAALDDLDAAPARSATTSDDAEVAAALASLEAALDEPPRRLSDMELLAASLAMDLEVTPPRSPVEARVPPRESPAVSQTLPPPPTPRGTSRAAARPTPAETSAPRTLPPPPTPRGTPRAESRTTPAPTTGRSGSAYAPPQSSPRATTPRATPQSRGARPTPRLNERQEPARRPWPIFAIILGLVALLAVIGGMLLFESRVAVAVTPPVRPETIEPIAALPVPIGAPAAAGNTAVAAEPVRADVLFMAEGQVTEGTLTPAGTAGGTINILNSTPQQVLLPAGTEFVAVKADGQEVPFVSTGEVLVPGATTSDTGAQIVTSRGQAAVAVMARSPGSASNVEANSIRRVTPPGGVSFNVDTGGFIVQNPPLEGGTEEEVFIVKESDVQPLFAPVLEGLDAEGRRQLDALAQARGLRLETTTILPRRADLEQLQGFETRIEPPTGTTLDPANPRFTLTALAGYSGLATPPDRSIEQQVGAALTEQLRQAGRLQPGDCRTAGVTGWRWDGESLLVDGQTAPDTQSPGCQGGLDQATLDRVRDAVRGKPRPEAEAALQELVAQGIIGSYTLPDVERLPGWDWQLTIRG